ncbi:dihydrofolate reductase [Geodermatophilus normandii]|uniref:Dihydrofolate reductase n=1 Tax=Geodermatophilus normandii TaxID=1137989 RepID=A0A317QCY1_9ACTN|nr:dihydrofolate reductase family protein [Geodermatophilus normandii]PWW20903.1 dihydrofolate reductase [Geodermatophilus normandii]
MRTLAITQNTTVDGSIEMITDWFSPLGSGDADTSDLVEENHRQDSQADALLLGRQTFEDFRDFWPQQTEYPTGVSDHLNRVHKYVVSTTLTDPQWENSTVLSGDPVSEVAALEEQPGQDIVLTGSISLAHTLITAGLVDEYRLFVYPAVQGRGRRLFPDGYEVPRLRLTGSRAFVSGITLQRYATR